MKILHTEASPGWGGQELRILREAEGMRNRGHQLFFALQKGGGLVEPAKSSGFPVFELSFKKSNALFIAYHLIHFILKEKIEIINTHSSLDAWIAGFVGRLCGRPVIRTRHLSTAIRRGLNSRLLYNWLADRVVTTCEEAAQTIRQQANLPISRCLSIPTGIDPSQIQYSADEVIAFRRQWGVQDADCLVGTLCILRGWKGVSDLLQAAKLLEGTPHLKWIVVGSGVSAKQFHDEARSLSLEKNVIFSGYHSTPYIPLAAMDIFLLLSRAHEGVSQASLQAAWLEKPLITTSVGGLKEVCLDGITGFQVPSYQPQAVADAVLRLMNDSTLRYEMGRRAKELVSHRFLFSNMLDKMEEIYRC